MKVFLVGCLGAIFAGSALGASTFVFRHLAGPPEGSHGELVADRPQVYQIGGIAVDPSGKVYVTSAERLLSIDEQAQVHLVAGDLHEQGSSDGSGSSARFYEPAGMVSDAQGNIYIADTFNRTIRRVTPAGVVTTLAGTAGAAPGTIDGVGAAARFHTIADLAIDHGGIIYATDSNAHVVRKITAEGVVTTLAGVADVPGATDGVGAVARFNRPQGIAVSADGTLYVCDSENSTIRKITTDGIVATLAGAPGHTGSADGSGSAAVFSRPRGIAVDARGDIYVADTGNGTIRRITPSGVVSTVAGSAGRRGAKEGRGSAARFDTPTGLAIDASGTIYVADGALIRRMTRDGLVAGFHGGDRSGSTDGTGAEARFDHPWGLVVDRAGNTFVADSGNSTIRRIDPQGVVTTFAGSPGETGSADGAGAAARFFWPHGMAIDAADNLYVADTGNNTIRHITPAGVVTTLAGQAGVRGDADGPGRAAMFIEPRGVAVDAQGNVYVADTINRTIRRISPSGDVTTFAGAAQQAGLQDGMGAVARFNLPHALAVDAAGNLYVGDSSLLENLSVPGNNVVRRITPAGEVTTMARGFRFGLPFGLAISAEGRLLVSEFFYHRILEILPNGDVATLTGRFAYAGDQDGGAPIARFDSPAGLAFDRNGNLYVVDSGNHAIRKGVLTNTAEPSIAWPAPAAIREGTALTELQLSAKAEVPGTFFYTPGAGVVLSPGTHRLTVSFVPDDLERFAVVNGEVAIVVLPKSQGARLVALSARCRAGGGDQTLIMGFVVEGSKQVLLQGIGPGIASSVPTALTDPQLKVYRLSGGQWATVAENNDWVNSAAILEARTRLGASAVAQGSKDAALLEDLNGGVYTAHVTTTGAAGVALVEAYDADGSGGGRLKALATRTVAGAGDDTLIAGLVLEGNGPRTVLIRGLGPTLASRDGVTGVLSDPQLKLYRMAGGTSTLIGENDNWGGTAEMKEVFGAIGAGAMESETSKDAALLVTLDPGVYTVHVSGAAATTGVALVEVFDVE